MRLFSTIFFFLICFNYEVYASTSLSYSGRLVQVNGAPVTGPVNLRAELVYTNATSTVLCSQNLSAVALTKGVFHLKLDLNCTPKTITQVLSETPNGESVAIRIIDQTNSKSYPLQAIHSVPFSKVAEQLPQMGASTGHALAWDGAKWAPTAVGTGNGTVTNIVTGTGLTGGPISTTGTISVAAGGITSTELAANSVTASKINAGEISSTHISGTAAIPYSKLSIGVGEIPQDRINGLSASMSALIEDVIADAVTGKAPSQNAVYDALNLKADRSNVAQNITAASVVGLTAPTLGSAAANRDYVDNSATILDTRITNEASTLNTRITNEVATLNTSLGNKYDKAGGVISGDVTLNTQLLLKGGSNFVTVKANSGTANYTMTFPTSAGTSGYVLQTDGAGVLSWVNPSAVVTGTGTVNSASITDGSIVDADINASANIAQSKIAGLSTSLSGKENTITAGTTAQYFRGDKTFVDLGTDVRGTVLTGFATGANSTILNTDTTLSAFQKVQGQINATNTAVTGKEPTLTAGTTAQYYRGDKSWQTLNGTAVANTPAGSIASTNVQTALNELDTEKQANITAATNITTGSVTTSLQNGVNINPFNTAAGNTGELRFYELSANGSNYTSLKAPDALASNINYVMPSVAPTVGQVLSSSAAGVLSWISIPSAPVTTVFGRSGAVTATAGDYSATLVTNTPAGTIAGTTVQAALNELDTEKEPLITAGTTAQYIRGNKTLSTFAIDVIGSVLSTFTVGTGTKPAVVNTDTVAVAFGKVQKTINDINSDYVSKTQDQTINGTLAINSATGFITVPTPINPNDAANKAYVDGISQWTKTGSHIYYTTGNVGVGTSTPTSYPFEVKKATSGGGFDPTIVSNAPGGRILIGSHGGVNKIVPANSAGTAAQTLYVEGPASDVIPQVYLNTNDLKLQSTSSQINFGSSRLSATGTSSFMGGSVGVGVTPTANLHVKQNASDQPFKVTKSDSTDIMWVDWAGRIFMDTNSNSTVPLLTVGNGNFGGRLLVLNGKTGNTSNLIEVKHNSVDRMTISHDGFMHIGLTHVTSSPKAALEIDHANTTGGSTAVIANPIGGNGNPIYDDAAQGLQYCLQNGYGGYVSHVSNTTGGNRDFYSTSGTWAVNASGPIASSITCRNGISLISAATSIFRGNVGVGTNAPSEKLEVVGNVKATEFLYSSDERLKHDIKTLSKAIDKVLKLRGVEFKWNKNDEKTVGFIAQEVEKVLPELVKTDKYTSLKSVQYGNLVALLVEALKEENQSRVLAERKLSSTVEKMQSDMKKLENENIELKKRLDKIEKYLNEKR